MVEVVLARLDPPAERVGEMAGWLSEAERQRASRLRFERDRRRFVVARSRLRGLLGARLGARPEALELEYGANGKPQLARRLAQSGWRFNMSHSDEVALYAFSRETDVGVDIEAVRPIAEADAIAARFFSPREREDYFELPPQLRSLGFYRCWTRKEALAKALGGGLSLPPDASAAPGGWRLESFCPLPGFIAALAARP